jgi:hypothetical protein
VHIPEKNQQKKILNAKNLMIRAMHSNKRSDINEGGEFLIASKDGFKKKGELSEEVIIFSDKSLILK